MEAFCNQTTPPSDLGEGDAARNTLYAASPKTSGFSYPSPAPSDQTSDPDKLRVPHIDLVDLSDLLASSLDSDMLSGNYLDATSQPPTTLPPVADISELSMNNPFVSAPASQPVFDAGQWFQDPRYLPSIPTSYAYDATINQPVSFNNLDNPHIPMGISTSVIPPTPQELAPVNFDFSAPLLTSGFAPQDNMNHFNTPERGSVPSHRSSISSLSRSCSPRSQTFMIPMLPSSSGSAMLTSLSSTHPTQSSSNRRLSSRADSVSSTTSLHAYGIPVSTAENNTQQDMALSAAHSQQAWRCAYPGCTSRAIFTRGCDLRKHYNRHSKHLFCRVDGCPQSEAASRAAAAANPTGDGILAGGFSSKKDRARHEAKHNPGIRCEWKGPHGEECGRVFSRVDNMKDHVRRIHRKGEQSHQHPRASISRE